MIMINYSLHLLALLSRGGRTSGSSSSGHPPPPSYVSAPVTPPPSFVTHSSTPFKIWKPFFLPTTLSSPPTRVQQYVTLILCNIVVVNFTRLNKANCCCFSFYSVQTYFRRFISEFSKGGAFGDELPKHHIFWKCNFISEMHLRNQYFILKKTRFRKFISESTFFSKKSTVSKMDFQNKGYCGKFTRSWQEC